MPICAMLDEANLPCYSPLEEEFMRLLIATRNPGKVREYAELLEGLSLDLCGLADLGLESEVDETGQTFSANAQLKATVYCHASGLLTFADDSGLEVEVLGGAPGVFSARYAGHGASDADRVRKLLAALEGVPWDKRGARFRCVIALAWPDGRLETFEGQCDGVIAFEPKGTNGFGFDPVFYMPEHGCTMAELPMDVKNRISHRGRAAALAFERLKDEKGGFRFLPS
jgi:XTP/dITP diphosphohydrolase